MPKEVQPTSATPETGTQDEQNNANEAGAEATPKRRKKTTSEVLFPDLIKNEEERAAAKNPKVPAEMKKEPDQTEVKAEEDVIDFEAMKSKKAPIKVDGKEGMATLEEMRAAYQQREHLLREQQKLGEERRRVAEEREKAMEYAKEIERQRMEISRLNGKPDSTSSEKTTNDPYIQKLEAELLRLREELSPVVVKTNRQKVTELLKAEGFDDAEKWDSVVDSYLGSIEDPRVLDREVARANSFDGAMDIFRREKIKEYRSLLKNNETPKPDASKKFERAPAPVVSVESGRQPSAGISDDYDAKSRELLEKWKENPRRNTEKLTQLLRLKGAIGR